MRFFRSSSLRFAAPILAGCISALVTPALEAADVYLTASDPGGTTSFTLDTRWSDFALPSPGNNYFTGGSQLRTPTSGAITFGGDSLSIDSGGSMLFKGPGLVTITDLILNGGMIAQGSTGATPDVATLAGKITVNAASTIHTTTDGVRTITVNSLIGGTGGLTIAGGGGTVNFANTTNTFTGPITFTQTTALNVSSIGNGGAVSALGAATSDASNLVFSGGALRVTPSVASTTDRLFTLAGNGTIQSGTAAANPAVTFSNTGAIAFAGGGDKMFTLGGASTAANTFAPKITDNPEGGVTSLTKADVGSWTLTNVNTYTGTTTVNGGALVFSNLDNLGAGTAINLGGGTLRWAAGNTVDVTTRTVRLTGGTSGFDTNGQDVTLANSISGAGALRKFGSGILTLSGVNTFTGGVTIGNSNGGIRITNSSSLGVGSKTVTITGNQGTAQTPTLRLDGSQGSIVLPGSMSFVTSNDGRNGAPHPPAIINEAGNNIINGNFTLTTGGGGTQLLVEGGSLTINGTVTPNTSGRVLFLSGAGNGKVNGVIQNQSAANINAVTKEGAGTWVLNGANTYTGATSVQGGTLITNTASTGNGAVTVANGATFGVKAAAPGQVFTTSSLTLGTNSGAGLLFDLGAHGNPSTELAFANALTLNGDVNVGISGTNLSVGTFKLLSYTTLTDVGSRAFTLTAMPPRTTASITKNTAASAIELNISSFDYPRWTGAGSTTWDVNDGNGTGTVNWTEVNSGLATRYLQGAAGTDSVLFDDSAAADKATVNLSATLTPTYVTVNNTARTYTFEGAGKLSGDTALVKQGTGTLILANTGGNDYAGVTSINGGTLQVGNGVTAGAGQLGTGAVVNNATLSFNRPGDLSVGNTISGSGTMRHEGSGTLTTTGNLTGGLNVTQAGTGVLFLDGNNSFTGVATATSGTIRLGHNNALGATTGGTTISSGATLDINGTLVPVGEVVTISGSGVGGAGAVVNTGRGDYTLGLKNLKLAADAAIGGTARWDIRDNVGGIVGDGFKLTKVGSNEIAFRGMGETNLGDIDVNEGVLRFEADTLMGLPSKTATVNSGGTLDFWASTPVHDKKIVLNGGRLTVGSGTATLAGSVTMNLADTTFDSGNTLILNGVVGGNSNITKAAGGTLELGGTAANTYTGLATLAAGTLRLNKAAGTAAITGDLVLNGGTLALAAANQFAANSTVTINQGGTWNNGGSTVQTLKALTVNTAALQTLNAVNVTGTFSIAQGQHDINSGQSFTANTLSISGGANLRLGANSGASTANIGAGGLILSDGTLQLGQAGGAVEASVNLGGDVEARGFSFISNPNIDGPRILDLQGAARTFEIVDGITRVTPSIENGGVIKTGAGMLELTGVSTYAGDTVIQEGTLAVSGSISASANIDVRSSAILDVVSVFSGFAIAPGQTLKGTGDVMGSLRVDGTLAPGSGIGELTFDSDLTLAGIAQFEINKSGLTLSADLATASSLITFGGTLAVSASGGALSMGDTFQLFDATTYAGSFAAFELPALQAGLAWDTEQLAVNGTLAVVPEPASVGLLLMGTAALIGMRRPRRRC